MRYVQTSDNTFIRHIYNEVENIQWNDSLNTSVRRLSQSQREEFGISRLKMVTPPFFNTDTHIRKEGDALLINGIWTQNWIITESPEELKAINLRKERDTKLTLSDWIVVKSLETGIEVPSDWANYRQALRDLPTHSNWPNLEDGDWPTKP